MQTHPHPFPISRVKIPNRQALAEPLPWRIALISEHGDPAAQIGKDAAGGQNVYVRQVGEALAKLGWQVDMFTRKSNPDDATIVEHTPHCRTIRLVAGPEKYIPRDRLFEYMPAFVAAFQKFQQQEGIMYPLAHSNYWMSGWVGLELKKYQNLQLLHTYHSLGAIKYRTVDNIPAIAQTRLAVERQILEQSHCIISTSPQEMDDLRHLVSQRGRIEIIPCGTDIDNFQPISRAAARQQLGLDPQAKIVLYVGRFDPRKGIETLVRAYAQLVERSADAQHLRLLIVGGSDPQEDDGAERLRIEGIVNSLGIGASVEFVGMVGHDRLPLYYTAADVCAIPSHYEPFGLVAIEAMACGTPVVASDVGGLKFTVVPEETGLLVPAKDEAAFAQAIEQILTDDLWAQQMRKQAVTRVQDNFSWTGVAVQLSDLYRSLLARSILQPAMFRTTLVSTSSRSAIARAS